MYMDFIKIVNNLDKIIKTCVDIITACWTLLFFACNIFANMNNIFNE